MVISEAKFVKDANDAAWKRLIQRQEHLWNTESEPGVFTKKLIVLMKEALRKNHDR